MSRDFGRILLQPEQEDLFRKMVEVDKNIPRAGHRDFLLVRTFGGDELLFPGSPGGSVTVYHGDVETLADEGLLRRSYGSKGTPNFAITPLGHRYYEWLKECDGEGPQRVEHTIQRYLTADDFQRRHPKAFSRWSRAEGLLQSHQSPEDLTTVGHLCREAVQEFADDLVTELAPSGLSIPKGKLIDRLRAVQKQRKDQAGSTELAYLDAALNYWGCLLDLINRQLHGVEKPGDPLVLEDARRVVFQTAVVMFEIDRSLRRR